MALCVMGGAFKHKIMVMREVSEVLESMKGMNELVEVAGMVQEARKIRAKTPESMVIGLEARAMVQVDDML